MPRPNKVQIQTIIIWFLLSILLLIFLGIGLYVFNRDFRLTYEATVHPEATYHANGEHLPLPTHTTYDYRATETYIAYYSKHHASEVVAFYQSIADGHTLTSKTWDGMQEYFFSYQHQQFTLVIQSYTPKDCIFGLSRTTE